MSMSGVTVDDNVVEQFKQQQLRKTFKQLLYKLSDDKKLVIVEKSGDDQWPDFCTNLPEKECRYATFDYHLERDGMNKDKLIFVFWSPDSAPTIEKMLFASTKDPLKKKLPGIAFEVQANDIDDLDENEVINRIMKSDK